MTIWVAVNGLRTRTKQDETLRSSIVGADLGTTDKQLVTTSDFCQLSRCLGAWALVDSIEQTHFNGGPNRCI